MIEVISHFLMVIFFKKYALGLYSILRPKAAVSFVSYRLRFFAPRLSWSVFSCLICSLVLSFYQHCWRPAHFSTGPFLALGRPRKQRIHVTQCFHFFFFFFLVSSLTVADSRVINLWRIYPFVRQFPNKGACQHRSRTCARASKSKSIMFKMLC